MLFKTVQVRGISNFPAGVPTTIMDVHGNFLRKSLKPGFPVELEVSLAGGPTRVKDYIHCTLTVPRDSNGGILAAMHIKPEDIDKSMGLRKGDNLLIRGMVEGTDDAVIPTIKVLEYEHIFSD